MANVFDCANFFIEISKKNEDFDMTNMKLNKLLYFAKGIHLARTGKLLFEQSVQAWQHGPVIPCIYFKYNECGYNPILSVDDYSYDTFSSEELNTLIDVMREYGKYSAGTLRNMTHKPDTPWTSSYVEGEKIVIPDEALKNFFEKHPIASFKPSGNIPVTQVLPKDWYEPNEDEVWESYRK